MKISCAYLLWYSEASPVSVLNNQLKYWYWSREY